MAAERACGDDRRHRRDLGADPSQPHRPSDLRRRQRPGRRVSERRRRHPSAHDCLCLQRNRLRGRRHGVDHDDRNRRSSGGRVLYTQQRRRRRHRRRQPRGRPRRDGRPGHRRAVADARADGLGVPRHRPELRPGHSGHADRAGGDDRGPVRLSAGTQMKLVLSFLRERTIYALILLLAVFVVGVEIVRPGTVTPLWASNTILFAAPLAIMAGGQTLGMLTGGIDLSVASVATGAAYLLATNASAGSTTAIGLALLLGVLVGLINGIGVALLRVQPLVMTLGTGLMTGGVLIVYSQHMMASQPHVPDIIQTLGAGRVFGLVPIDLFLWLIIAALILFGLQRTGFGRLLYAVGDNREACHLAGVRVWRVLFANYLLCAILAAIAGLVVVGGTNAADLSLADSYLLPSVACVVIGGTSIFGGRGGYAGTIIGALILTVLTGLLTLLDVSEPIKQILYGAIILSLAAAYARLPECLTVRPCRGGDEPPLASPSPAIPIGCVAINESLGSGENITKLYMILQ